MFERFTGSARQAVVVAQREAANADADEISVGHLLRGLTYPGGGLSEMALAEVGIDFRALVGAGPSGAVGPAEGRSLPFAETTQQALKRSLTVTLELGQTNVSSGHLLIAVLENLDADAKEMLNDIDIPRLSARVRAMLGSQKEEMERSQPPELDRRAAGQRVPPPVAQFRRRTDFEAAMGPNADHRLTMTRAAFDAGVRASSPVRQSRVSEIIVGLVFAATIVSAESMAGGWRQAAFALGAIAVAIYAIAGAARSMGRPEQVKTLRSLRAGGVALAGSATVVALLGLAVGG